MENPPWLMFFLGDQLLTLKFQTGRQTVVELCVVMKALIKILLQSPEQPAHLNSNGKT